MNINAEVSWKSDLPFTEARDFSLSLVAKQCAPLAPVEQQGTIHHPEVVISYLKSLFFEAAGGDITLSQATMHDFEKPAESSRVYHQDVVDDKSMEKMLVTARQLSKTHYIVSRDETVTNEQYSAFFGSANGCWNPQFFEYRKGDFVETLRQTVYDMKNGHPHIYRWTNVPEIGFFSLEKFSATEEDFLTTVIKPLQEEMEALCIDDENHSELLADIFTRMADAGQKFMDEQGIEHLYFINMYRKKYATSPTSS